MLLLLACTSDRSPGATTDSDTAMVIAPVEVLEGPLVECAEPSLRKDEGILWSPEESAAWQGEQPDGTTMKRTGPGVAVGDLDGDGRYEVIFPNRGPSSIFSFDDEGSPVDTTDTFGLPREGRGAAAATVVDYDDDGDLDLLITAHRDIDRLFENQEGTLVDVTDDAFAEVLDYWASAGSTWGDMDGDGDLDLFVATREGPEGDDHAPPDDGPPNLLYENRDGLFVLREDVLSHEATANYSFGAAWIDLDLDGRLDLYQVNDFGPKTYGNRVLMNRTERPGEVVLEDIGEADPWRSLHAMGLGVGDLNGDDLPDLLIADWGQVVLLESSGPGVWVDTASARGLGITDEEDREVAWGSDLADLDNDGLLDAFTGFGEAFGSESDNRPQIDEQPDAIWLQSDDGTFRQVAESWGFAHRGDTRAVAAVDLNDDGWLDFIRRHLEQPPTLQYQRCGSRHWLKVRLEQPAPNVNAIGARVRIVAADTPQWRWLQAGGPSVEYGNPPELHFGLGDADTVEVVEVWWPDGALSVVESVSADRTLWVTRTE